MPGSEHEIFNLKAKIQEQDTERLSFFKREREKDKVREEERKREKRREKSKKLKKCKKQTLIKM